MADNLPLSSIIEVALQRAKSEQQLAYVMSLAETIYHLEECFAAESAPAR